MLFFEREISWNISTRWRDLFQPFCGNFRFCGKVAGGEEEGEGEKFAAGEWRIFKYF